MIAVGTHKPLNRALNLTRNKHFLCFDKRSKRTYYSNKLIGGERNTFKKRFKNNRKEIKKECYERRVCNLFDSKLNYYYYSSLLSYERNLNHRITLFQIPLFHFYIKGKLFNMNRSSFTQVATMSTLGSNSHLMNQRLGKLINHIKPNSVIINPQQRKLYLIIRRFNCTGNEQDYEESIETSSPSTTAFQTVSIGDVEFTVDPLASPSESCLVPIGYYSPTFNTQESLRTLRWMIQKYNLQQDMFLLGVPGSHRRRLALYLAELLNLPTEFLSITRDTTEADLKQRREIIGSHVMYVDQSPVIAATKGRLLIIEGIEKAERNVLPLLNNLLENREMALEDGRFLVHAKRYDELCKQFTEEQLLQRKLVRVHPNFRVVALGLPVPRYPGYPLDPPLRSRFQARRVESLQLNSALETLQTSFKNISFENLKALASFRETILVMENDGSSFSKRMPILTDDAIMHIGKLLNTFPQEQMLNSGVINRVYPFMFLCDEAQIFTIFEAMKRFGIFLTKDHANIYEIFFKRQAEEKNSKGKKAERSVSSFPIRPCETDFFMYPSNLLEQSKRNKCSIAKYAFELRRTGKGDIIHEGEVVGYAGLLLKNQLGSKQNQKNDKNRDIVIGSDDDFIMTDFHHRLMGPMLADHLCGRDFCVIGSRGCGKSTLVRYLSHSVLGYRTHHIHLFKDMTSRDLLQRRTTDHFGNTTWKATSLVKAAVEGDLAILDGLDRLPGPTLASLRTLIEDRELTLSDGSRLMRWDRYDELIKRGKPFDNEAALTKKRIYRISPAFRIIAVALSPDDASDTEFKGASWLTEETSTLFSFHYIPNLPQRTIKQLLTRKFPAVSPKSIQWLLNLANDIAKLGGVNSSSSTTITNTHKSKFSSSLVLSLRQLLRIVRHIPVESSSTSLSPSLNLSLSGVGDLLRRTLMSKFLPLTLKKAFDQKLLEYGIPQHEEDMDTYVNNRGVETKQEGDDGLPIKTDLVKGYLRIGDVSFPLNKPRNPELIPKIVFYDIRQHKQILQNMLKDFIVDDKHILLIGNQGVGKNKLADRLLELLRMEREYMQLHRDTTVQSLTLSPTLKNGVIVYEDSPLVRAATKGRVLVIDEADKAPLEVVSILKGLIEDGEMTLSDGRRLLSKHLYEREINGGYNVKNVSEDANDPHFSASLPWSEGQSLCVKPDFRVLILANRPGYPFLGNDFFRECGDIFSCHVIDNPDPESELQLLQSYAPSISRPLIEKLINVFGTLRLRVEEGVFPYPYSTRELVAIARHMELYPRDGLLTTLENVLHFDVFDRQIVRNLESVFHEHGIPVQLGNNYSNHSSPMEFLTVRLAKEVKMQPPQPIEKWTSTSTSEDLMMEDTDEMEKKKNEKLLQSNPTSAVVNSLSLNENDVNNNSNDVKFNSTEAVVTDLNNREWSVDMGTLYSVEHWYYGRFRHFSEQTAHWKVPLGVDDSINYNSTSSSKPFNNAIGLVASDDDSLFLLAQSPLRLLCFDIKDSYRKYSVLHLEDFLAVYNVHVESIRMISIPSQNTNENEKSSALCILIPSHNLLFYIEHLTSPSSSPKAHVTLLNVGIASGFESKSSKDRKIVSGAFLKYVTPGFRMPRFASESSVTLPSNSRVCALDTWSYQNLVFYYVTNGRAFTIVNFNTYQSVDVFLPESFPKDMRITNVVLFPIHSTEKSELLMLLVMDNNSKYYCSCKTEDLLKGKANIKFTFQSTDSKNVQNAHVGKENLSKTLNASMGIGKAWSLHSNRVDMNHNTMKNTILMTGLYECDNDDYQQLNNNNNKNSSNNNNNNNNNNKYNTKKIRKNEKKKSLLTCFLKPSNVKNEHLLEGLAYIPVKDDENSNGKQFDHFKTRLNNIEGSPAATNFSKQNESKTAEKITIFGNTLKEEDIDLELNFDFSLGTFVSYCNQYVIPSTNLGSSLHSATTNSSYYLSVVDVNNHTVRNIAIPPDNFEETIELTQSESKEKSQMRSTTSASNRRLQNTLSLFKDSEIDNDNDDVEESLQVSPVVGIVSLGSNNNSSNNNNNNNNNNSLGIKKKNEGDIVTLQANGSLRLWEINPKSIEQSLKNWQLLFGSGTQPLGLLKGQQGLRLQIQSNRNKEAKGPKHGKIDPKNTPHVGGNTWRGGTGGADTAGLGGVGGPYRLDAGHDVHQLSDEVKANVSEEVKKAAREIALAELSKRLKEIDMSNNENKAYLKFYNRVSKEIHQLRLILESVEAKNREREWLRHQTQGDLDDGKLVDGVTGDTQIFRRRGISPPQAGTPQRLAKRLLFLLDVSGSMYRFNSHDQRLDRLLEAALLIMESFEGFEYKYSYSFVGHSGDGPCIPLVEFDNPPKNRMERLKVLQRMHAHSQYCFSGDSTLQSVTLGMKSVIECEADDYFLFVVSDANLRRYGIPPAKLSEALLANDQVNAFAIFIASLYNEANEIIEKMPTDHAFSCPDVSNLPHIFQSIFTTNLLQN